MVHHWFDNESLVAALTFQQRSMSPALLDFLSRASIVLLTEARQLIADKGDKREDNLRLGVILAHAASDIQTDKALNDLIEWRRVGYLRDSLQGLSRPSFSDSRTRKVWTALSDDSPWSIGPNQAAWWQSWVASVDVRNDIAHKGEKITHSHAVASVDACEQLVLYLMRKVEELLKVADPRIDYSGSVPPVMQLKPPFG
jgi:hypothetical protein